jgi:hypothetical protein
MFIIIKTEKIKLNAAVVSISIDYYKNAIEFHYNTEL